MKKFMLSILLLSIFPMLISCGGVSAESNEVTFSATVKSVSDKIEVDGKEQNLGYTFALRDGLPVFRIKSLCDLLGYKYTVEANKIMIQSCTDAEYQLLGDLRGN